MPGFKSTPEEVAEICVGYQQGEKTDDLARRIGCDRKTVYNILKRNGIELRKNWGGRGHAPRPEMALIPDLYQVEELSYHEIAKKLGCDWTTVRRWVKVAGIPTRTPEEWHAILRKRQQKAMDELRERIAARLAEGPYQTDSSSSPLQELAFPEE